MKKTKLHLRKSVKNVLKQLLLVLIVVLPIICLGTSKDMAVDDYEYETVMLNQKQKGYELVQKMTDNSTQLSVKKWKF